MNTKIFLLCLYVITGLQAPALSAPQPEDPPGIESLPAASLRHPDLVDRLYEANGNQLVWFLPGEVALAKRDALIDCINGADSLGLSPAAYHRQILMGYETVPPGNEATVLRADRLFTDAAIAFCKDLYQGADMDKWISYDGISSRYLEVDNGYVLDGLRRAHDAEAITTFIHRLEPGCEGYNILKAELKRQVNDHDGRHIKQLTTSLNYYRWIRHFHLDSFIVINIASATLEYYKGDSILLSMRAVLGTPDKRTPRFAAYVKEVTLYPYWNMPRSILVNEWLPSFRKNPSLLNFLGMEIIDARGRIIDPATINWRAASRTHFPYRIREKTGCLNPLGVVKFTLTSPYDVYLHDTNFKGAFLSSNRYYSHGCIRIQDPVGLADAVLINKVDTGFLRACYKDQQPQVLSVANPIPVFVVYMTAEPGDAGIVRYYKDVYRLLK